MSLMRFALFFVLMLIFHPSCPLHGQEHGQRPNVLFILADDLGWGDLACFGNPEIETPALDSLAKDGVRLTAHYSPSPLCSPARAGFLTGRFNHRTGAVDVPSNRGLDRIDLSEKTFGDYFRHAGYSTALIGKWHNGLYCQDYLPHHRGFDRFFGFANGGQDYWKWNLLRNDVQVSHDGRYLSDVFNDEAIQFIRDSKSKEKPFALFLAHHAPHSPLQAPNQLIKKYIDKLGGEVPKAVAVVYAMIESMDSGLGRVFQALKDKGMWENTIVVFTSDNGPTFGRDRKLGSQKRFNGNLSGEKQFSLEGGIRVPAIVAWPGTIPPRQTNDMPVHGCDWLPTLFSLTGSSPPKNAKPLDGIDIMPLLKGAPTRELTERTLNFQRNRYAPVKHCNAAVRRGRWKLYWPGSAAPLKKDSARDNPSYLRGITNPHWEMPLDRQLDSPTRESQPAEKLFDLTTDPSENNDVAMANRDVVQSLTRQHDRWFSEVQSDWRKSRQSIVNYDKEYWNDRSAPDPAKLFKDHWLWSRAPKGTDPSSDDPLTVFTGFWNSAASRGLLIDPDSTEWLSVPEISTGQPAAGKRVNVTPSQYAGTDVYHTLYLPPSWSANGEKIPIIFEYTGNHFPRSGSTGEVEGAALGYGLSAGKFIWVSLPYISDDHNDNAIRWWGDQSATIDYAKKYVPKIIAEFNADPDAVFLCGFSRGAIGVNYIGLHDDEIAKLWTAFITHDHFDGVRHWGGTTWGSPLDKYRKEAAVRLRRVGKRPYLVSQNGSTAEIEEFVRANLSDVSNFTFSPVRVGEILGRFPNDIAKTSHTDAWLVKPSLNRQRTWKWMNEVLAGQH